ncbi:hypothetical protein GQ53DRAFT_875333 [Thozetella sp. PMI_491]|nr:hypothetical protein GQ53DRAFT_875333 [Thozetella sp. PMI_491]
MRLLVVFQLAFAFLSRPSQSLPLSPIDLETYSSAEDSGEQAAKKRALDSFYMMFGSPLNSDAEPAVPSTPNGMDLMGRTITTNNADHLAVQKLEGRYMPVAAAKQKADVELLSASHFDNRYMMIWRPPKVDIDLPPPEGLAVATARSGGDSW